MVLFGCSKAKSVTLVTKTAKLGVSLFRMKDDYECGYGLLTTSLLNPRPIFPS